MKYILYILRCADNSLYTGITNDLEARLATHRAGKGSKYVRSRLPVAVVYTEEFETKSEAMKREIKIKQMDRQGKDQLLTTSST